VGKGYGATTIAEVAAAAGGTEAEFVQLLVWNGQNKVPITRRIEVPGLQGGRIAARTVVVYDSRLTLLVDGQLAADVEDHWVVHTRHGSCEPITSARSPRPSSPAGRPTKLCSKWPGTAHESRGLAFQVVGVIT
jgi:hypothetical protein